MIHVEHLTKYPQRQVLEGVLLHVHVHECPALSRKTQGTGLGLPLTKALIELHGGVLDS